MKAAALHRAARLTVGHHGIATGPLHSTDAARAIATGKAPLLRFVRTADETAKDDERQQTPHDVSHNQYILKRVFLILAVSSGGGG